MAPLKQGCVGTISTHFAKVKVVLIRIHESVAILYDGCAVGEKASLKIHSYRVSENIVLTD